MGQKIRFARLSKGVSQMALAEMLGLTFQQVQKYEKGVNRITVGRLSDIAAALEHPMQWFLSEEPLGENGQDMRPETWKALVSGDGAKLRDERA